jgi:Zn-dependent M32 family carboxypeptidase
VQPGKYTVRLTAGGQSQSQPLEIVLDPRMKNIKLEDLQKQFELAVQVNEANNELHRAVNQVRTMRGELKSLEQRFNTNPQMKPLLEHAAALDKKMAPVEEQLIQVNMKGSEANLAFPNMLNEQFDSFSALVQAGDSAPTQQQYEAFKHLRGQLDQQLAAWKQIMAADVPAFNDFMKGINIPALYLSPNGE